MEDVARFDPFVGTQVAGYKLEALIGRGGMSVVYRAQQEHLDRKVAVKLLAPELSQDERFRQRFVRESRVAASLDHPNIIPIYDAGEAQGLLYIAMRFVDGCTLSQYLERRRALTPSVALSVIEQIASALDVAHAAGLVHRDVKPENVLITEDRGELDRIFLSDFGLTKRPNASGTTRSGELMGTVGYVAPEQIEGKPLDGRSDVYSLGCILYQCVTGFRPYELDNDVAILWAHLNKPVPSITERQPDLPQEMDKVVAKALAKEPQDRFGTAGELAAAARRAFGSEVEPREASVERTSTRKPPMQLALFGLAALVTVGVILLISRALAPDSPNLPTLPSDQVVGERLPTAPINSSSTSHRYRNPIVVHNAPDPAIIAAHGTYYAYTTQSVYTQLVHMPVLASQNLTEWRFIGDALSELPPWANKQDPDTWAPDIVRKDGNYLIYFAERLESTGAMAIAVATATSPRGPFQVVAEPLLTAPGSIAIDPFVLKGPNGRLLMYWGSYGAPIRVRQLSEDGKSFVGAPRPVLYPSSATSYDKLVEGPAVIRHQGFYYLFYSGNRCCGKNAHYAVLVARSRSPWGPFERAPANPLIAANKHFVAPGHGTVFEDHSGASFMLYHAIDRSDPTRLRYLMLDRIHWTNDWPVVNGGAGPSFSAQPRPQLGSQP